jgi:hypothetical protein
MYLYALIAVILTLMLPMQSSFAITAKEKMATCEFGAENQKLKGAARTAFLKRCMSDKNDPRGTPAAGAANPDEVPPPKN